MKERTTLFIVAFVVGFLIGTMLARIFLTSWPSRRRAVSKSPESSTSSAPSSQVLGPTLPPYFQIGKWPDQKSEMIWFFYAQSGSTTVTTVPSSEAAIERMSK